MTNQPEAVRARIKSILVRVLDLPIDPSEIGDDTLLFDGRLGMDSVAAIEIVTAVEEAFGVRIADERIGLRLFQNANTLAEAVEEQGGTLQSRET
jgi:acyl carrier protein